MRIKSEYGRGLVWGFISCSLWGFFPIYWKYLAYRNSMEILAHRMIWSFVFYLCIYLVSARKDLGQIFRQSRSDWKLSAIGALFLTLNWGIYIFAVNSGQILEGSLAYFLTPILNVAVGMLFFGEKIPLALKISISIAAVGVVIRIFYSSTFPWISLILAGSFCTYGATKKMLKIKARVSSVLEGAVGLIPAVVAICWFGNDTNTSPIDGMTWLLFIGGGVITGAPLFLYSYAAQRVPFSVLGVMQFISPTLQFLIAIYLFKEKISRPELLSFIFIWIGILFYLGNQFFSRGRYR